MPTRRRPFRAPDGLMAPGSLTARPEWTTSSRPLRLAPHDRHRRRRRAAGAPVERSPSAWLWLLALIAAFNPARVALGVPTWGAGERRRERATIAAAGATAGSVSCCSRGRRATRCSMRSVSRVGIPHRRRRRRRGRRRRHGLPSSSASRASAARPRAALVPVAVPLVANAALVMLTIGAAADRGPGHRRRCPVAGTTTRGRRCHGPDHGSAGRVLGAAPTTHRRAARARRRPPGRRWRPRRLSATT